MTGEEYLQSILDHLHNAYMLDDEKIKDVLPRFLDTLLAHLNNLQQPLLANDLQELGRAGHTLKGALLNLGLLELADIAYSIEQQCKIRNVTADYQVLVQQLRREINSFVVR